MLAICISDFGINSYDFVSIYYLVEVFLSKHVERFQKLSAVLRISSLLSVFEKAVFIG